MTGILKKVIVFGLLAGLASCSILNGSKKRSENPLYDTQKMVDPQTGKEVVFVRMRHLGTGEGYTRVRTHLDKLKAEGYVTFCESVVVIPFHLDTVGEVTMRQLGEADFTLSAGDSLRLDTLLRKCRRTLGFMLGERGYVDPGNESLKIKRKERKYISQSEELLGLTTDKDLWADYSLQDLVEVCEQRHGTILLTDYDWKTGLYEEYAPAERTSQRMHGYFKIFARNNYLVKRIAESPHSKIAVVYGSGHSFGVIHFLKKTHGFRIDRKYKVE